MREIKSTLIRKPKQKIKAAFIWKAMRRVYAGKIVTLVAAKNDENPTEYLIGILAVDARPVEDALIKAGFKIEILAVKKEDFI